MCWSPTSRSCLLQDHEKAYIMLTLDAQLGSRAYAASLPQSIKSLDTGYDVGPTSDLVSGAISPGSPWSVATEAGAAEETLLAKEEQEATRGGERETAESN